MLDDAGEEIKLPLKGVVLSEEQGRVLAVNLKFNNIEGELASAAVFGLSLLQSLDLQGNGLQGCIPPAIAELRQLRVLNLSQVGSGGSGIAQVGLATPPASPRGGRSQALGCHR